MRISSDSNGHPLAPVLEVVGLSAGYGAASVVDEVDLSLAQGEIVTVLGPNGAGKSTFLKALTGRLRPSAGRVRLDGHDITGMAAHRLARLGVGYVPQAKDVFPTLTVRENLELGGYLLPSGDVAAHVERVVALVPALGPLLDRTVKSLSGGERKLLGIARSLMLEPRVLLLDEPTASLAPAVAQEVLSRHVRALADEGTAVLLVEQRVKDALAVADRGYVMVGGRVRATGRAADLLAREDVGDMFLGVVG